jgi:hypothetical protein
VSGSYKVSSSDCICSPEAATRVPSLIFGPLQEPHVAWPTQLNYISESKIIRTIGTCFAVGYTAGWA